MSAETLAQIERAHLSAARVHEEASTKAASIEQRLTTINDRIAAISAARVAGTATATESDELVLATHDKTALERMYADVQAEVKANGDNLHAVAVAYSDALTAHKREQAQLEFLALRQKAGEIEAMLVRAIAETHRVGKALGHSVLSSSWQPSQAMHRAITMNVPPEVA
ncbi:MAG: hypothetical protein ACOYNZ_07350 [Rhodoferax sp.]